MKVTKLGHCCLVLEVDGVRLLTDPGIFSTAQNDLKDIDALLITHEHGDHFHIDSVKAILANNPGIPVITNAAVGALLAKEGIAHVEVGDGQATEVKGVAISGHGRDHAPIYETVPSVENTGFYVAKAFFFPGDGFFVPNVPVEVLALPVAGPWMKISEALDYARALKPRVVFPVHDAVIDVKARGIFHGMPERILKQFDIRFVPMGEGESQEL